MDSIKPLHIVTNYTAGVWTAFIYAAGVLQTQAKGRDEGAAVADAVAKFRLTRAIRHAA